MTTSQRQGCPRVLTALQQASLGRAGLKGATAGLHGISCSRAKKKVLVHAWPAAWPANPTASSSITTQALAMVVLVAPPASMTRLAN